MTVAKDISNKLKISLSSTDASKMLIRWTGRRARECDRMEDCASAIDACESSHVRSHLGVVMGRMWSKVRALPAKL